MGRFYFHYRTKTDLVTDLEGEEFQDVESARREAVLAARDTIADALIADRLELLEGAYEITDEDGRIVAVVPFRSVIGVDLPA